MTCLPAIAPEAGNHTGRREKGKGAHLSHCRILLRALAVNSLQRRKILTCNVAEIAAIRAGSSNFEIAGSHSGQRQVQLHHRYQDWMDATIKKSVFHNPAWRELVLRERQYLERQICPVLEL